MPHAGLYYYGARWYDPALARFVQPDTVAPATGDPQAWNRYSYVGNSPLTYRDPTGHRRDWAMHDSLGPVIVSLSTFNQMDEQQAVNYSVNAVEYLTGRSLPAEVAVEYGGWAFDSDLGLQPYNGANPLVDAPELGMSDSSIYIQFTPGFIPKVEDLVGVTAEEVHHFFQESEIEAAHGVGVWDQPAPARGLPCSPVCTAGERYRPAAEIEAKNATGSLGLDYSDYFNYMQNWQIEGYQSMIDRYPDYYHQSATPVRHPLGPW